MSAWNASTCRSNISSAYSLNVSGTPTGRSGTAKSLLWDSLLAMRCSTSRMASRYSLSLTPSRAPSLPAKVRDLLRHAIENAAVFLASGHALFGGVPAAEQPFEDKAWIGFRRQRHRRASSTTSSSCRRRRSRGRRRRRRRCGRRPLPATRASSRDRSAGRSVDRSSCRPAHRRLRSASGAHSS